MSRTSWVAPGKGESLQTLLAYTIQNAAPVVALHAAQWMIENAYTYERYATARTGLLLEIAPTRREDDYDFARVKAVLRDINEQGPEEYFGQDLVRAAGGAELSVLDVGARQVRALAEGIENLGRAIDRANESRMAAARSLQLTLGERDRLQAEVTELRRQLTTDRGAELAPAPTLRGSWVVVDEAGLRLWDGHGWTDDTSQAVRFSTEQVDDIVGLGQSLAEQGLPAGLAYAVRDYGVPGQDLWKDFVVAPARGQDVEEDLAPAPTLEMERAPRGGGMASLATVLPAMGLSR